MIYPQLGYLFGGWRFLVGSFLLFSCAAFALPIQVCPPVDLASSTYCASCFARPNGTANALFVAGSDTSLVMGITGDQISEGRFVRDLNGGDHSVMPDGSYSSPCGIRLYQPVSSWKGSPAAPQACQHIQTVFVHQTSESSNIQKKIDVICSGNQGLVMIHYILNTTRNTLEQVGSIEPLGLSSGSVVNSLSVEVHDSGSNYYGIVNNGAVWQWSGRRDEAFYPVGILEPTPGSHDQGVVRFDFIIGNFTEAGSRQVYLGGKTQQNNIGGVFIERFRQGRADPFFNGGAPLFIPQWDRIDAYSFTCEDVRCQQSGFFASGTGFRTHADTSQSETGIWIHRYLANGQLNSSFNSTGQLFVTETSTIHDLRLQTNETLRQLSLFYQKEGRLYWRRFDYNGTELSPHQWQADLQGITVTTILLVDDLLHVTGFINQHPQYLTYSVNQKQSLNIYGGSTSVTAPVPSGITLPPSVSGIPGVPNIPTNISCPPIDIPQPTLPDISTNIIDLLGLGFLTDSIPAWEVSVTHVSVAAASFLLHGAAAYGMRSCSQSIKKTLSAICCWTCKLGDVKSPREFAGELSQVSSHVGRALSNALSRNVPDGSLETPLTDLVTEDTDMETAFQGAD